MVNSTDHWHGKRTRTGEHIMTTIICRLAATLALRAAAAAVISGAALVLAGPATASTSSLTGAAAHGVHSQAPADSTPPQRHRPSDTADPDETPQLKKPFFDDKHSYYDNYDNDKHSYYQMPDPDRPAVVGNGR
jgi:hypothetical protein